MHQAFFLPPVLYSVLSYYTSDLYSKCTQMGNRQAGLVTSRTADPIMLTALYFSGLQKFPMSSHMKNLPILLLTVCIYGGKKFRDLANNDSAILPYNVWFGNRHHTGVSAKWQQGWWISQNQTFQELLSNPEIATKLSITKYVCSYTIQENNY